MKKLKKDTRKPIQVDQKVHAVIKAVSNVKFITAGQVVEDLVKEKYKDMF